MTGYINPAGHCILSDAKIKNISKTNINRLLKIHFPRCLKGQGKGLLSRKSDWRFSTVCQTKVAGCFLGDFQLFILLSFPVINRHLYFYLSPTGKANRTVSRLINAKTYYAFYKQPLNGGHGM